MIASKSDRAIHSSSAVSILVGKANGYEEAIAMMPNTPSPRPVRLIAGASHHPSRNRTRPASVIALSLSIAPAVFQARHAARRLFANSPSRSSSRLIPSRRASRSYIGLSINAVFVIPPSRVLLVGSCSPPSHRQASNTASLSPSPSPASSYISIISSYPCILVSFYTSHTSYSLYTPIDET